MGNDGGSIPTRRELVKSAARAPTTSELKATALESLSHAWTHCPLSSEPLDMNNVVSDWRGRLYNYESILQGLMPSADPDGAPELVLAEDSKKITFASTGIKSLKDVAKLQFTRAEAGGKGSLENTLYVCPLSQKELGPSTKSVYIVPCGHVFYDTALKEIAPEGEAKHTCPQCGEEFEHANIIPILPTEEKEVARLAERIERLRSEGLTHKLKKDKSLRKERKRKAGDGVREENEEKNKSGGKKHKSDKFGGINNSATASLTAKVVAELEVKSKRRKLVGV